MTKVPSIQSVDTHAGLDASELSEQELSAARMIVPFLRRDCLVVIADGAGSPLGLGRALARAAAQVGGVRLVVGWSFETPVPVESSAFTDIRVLVGGYGLREATRLPHVHYVPVRLSSIPALLHTSLRPDVLIAGVRPVDGGVGFGSEVSWMRSVVDQGVPVLAELNHGLPAAADDGALPAGQVTIVSEVDRPPLGLPVPSLTDEVRAIADHIATLVTPNSVVQYGPGMVGDAAIRRLNVPVRVHSGLVTDAVVDLDRRGLLVGNPVAAYVVGTPSLYQWSDGRPIATRIERSHDLSYLSDLPFFAINTALEIDLTGQINVEGFGETVVAAVGGHPDFAVAGGRAPGGLSIAAVPTRRGRHRTLVHNLSVPASTARCDVDVVVTEHGIANLRGLDDAERRRALVKLWDWDPRNGTAGGTQ
jgi:acyl-CoA hydrolase